MWKNKPAGSYHFLSGILMFEVLMGIHYNFPSGTLMFEILMGMQYNWVHAILCLPHICIYIYTYIYMH